MRENDDASGEGASAGSLAEGLGETAEPGEYASTSEPYGDAGFDDTYEDDTYGDDTYGDADSTVDDTEGDGDSYGDEDSYGDDDTYGTDGGYGDGDGDDTGDSGDVDGTVDPADSDILDEDGGIGPGQGGGLDESDLLTQDASPIEGVGYLIEQVREALFGDDEAASPLEADPLASAFEPDPADLATDTGLDATGDGVVDGADLHEAEWRFDFGVSGDG